MKLYATTTSERATKGQGGNVYLLINLKGDNGVELANIKLTSSYPYEYNLDIFPIVYDKFTPQSAYKLKVDIKGNGYKVKQTKGKSQKGDN